MRHIEASIRLALAAALSAFALAHLAAAQDLTKVPPAKDSVVVIANRHYAAGSLQRSLLGDNWRNVWTTPIKVAVLDLRRFAGGLKPTDTGGSAQTTSLRFVGADGRHYAFRPVYKDRLVHLEPYENTIVADVFRDGLSALHPTGPLAVPPFLEAAGIIHPTPILYVMPNDVALGKFREEFAGKLGAIEDRGMMPEEGPGLGGAVEILDSEELLERINADARHRVDSRAYLTARLIDLLVNDNDRHLNQWRWVRIQPRLAGSTTGDEVVWVPMPRDRDAAFVNHKGLLMRVARIVKPNLVSFDADYPRLRAFLGAVIDLDQRLLVELERPVWDSIATWLKGRITDAVIDTAVGRMPREYLPLHGDLIAKLRSRRDKLHNVANEFYGLIAETPEIHATDSADRAIVTREGGDVIVRIQRGDATPWFNRRFKDGETREIRLYMHGGDDRALVTGNGTGGIFVRVIGGNGTNTLVDSSLVDGRTRLTRLYDRGTVDDIKYGKDTIFNRRPWVKAFGKQYPPLKDRGASAGPTIGFGSGSGLGIVSKIGYQRKTYGFRYMPYKSKTAFEVEYATKVSAFRLGFEADRRIESSQLHYLLDAEMSQLEIVEFRGFGNTVEDSDDAFFDVSQTQWMFRPAVGFAISREGDLSLGPIFKYVTTDSVPDTFIAEEVPLGFPRFGQAGLQLRAQEDTRDSESTRGFTLLATASYYPALLDVSEPFGEVSALATTYLTIPILTRPTIALRGGAKRVFGDAPYFESAFVGGRRSLRTMHRQRFAGDAALHGTTELRLPIARFNWFLPWNIGAIGFMEAGRVYVDGESPGTWHSAQGVGGWIGLLSPKYSIQILHTNRPERRLIIGTGFAF